MNSKKVSRWCTRFVQKGRIGIERDESGRGRKLTYPVELREFIIEKTKRATPPDATRWSRNSMAKSMDISPSTAGHIWRENGLKRLQKT